MGGRSAPSAAPGDRANATATAAGDQCLLAAADGLGPRVVSASSSRTPRAPAGFERPVEACWRSGGEDERIGNGRRRGREVPVLDAVHQRHSDVEQARRPGRSWSARRTASRPSTAAPTTSMSGWALSSIVQPGVQDGLVVGDEDPDARSKRPCSGRDRLPTASPIRRRTGGKVAAEQ